MTPRHTVLLFWLLSVLAALQSSATAQVKDFQQSTPVLPSKASKLTDFVPPGWTLEQQQLADLNHDGRVDALLLLRRQAASGGSDRILAVVLRDRGNDAGYILSGSNDQLIPRTSNTDQVDPMEDGEITSRRDGFE